MIFGNSHWCSFISSSITLINPKHTLITHRWVANEDEIVNVYTILGVKLQDNVRRADIHLNSGLYIIESQNGARTELNIK